MRRVVMLLATMMVALVLVARVSLAKPHEGKKGEVTAEPLETTAGLFRLRASWIRHRLRTGR